MKNKRMLGNLLLFAAAVIWGCSFVAQSEGMDYVGSFTFQSVRSLLAGFALLPFIGIMSAAEKKKPEYKKTSREEKKYLWKSGLICGVIFCVAACLQQIGIEKGRNPGKAAFITALYIILVPLFRIVMKKYPPARIWISVALAVGGLYCLCITGGFSGIGIGDLYCLACAAGFACHILALDYYGSRVDCVKLSCIQFFTAGILAGIPMLIWEEVSWQSLLDAAVPLLYAGILSGGAAFTFQAIGQKYTKPESASLIMSLESVVAVLAGIVILRQFPTSRETVGCILMFAAILLAQLEPRKKEKKQSGEMTVRG